MKAAPITLKTTGGGKWWFEWIIPPDAEQDTLVSFDIVLQKDGMSYGSEKWYDVWAPGNTGRHVFHIWGHVKDSLIYSQSN